MSTALARDPAARAFYTLLLTSKREGNLTIVGVVALQYSGVTRNMPAAMLLHTLADALLANNEVDAVTCIA